MKAYWQQLEEKDKKLVSILGVTVLIAIVYWFIWQPLVDDIAKTKRQITAQSNTLAEVKSIGQKIVNLQGGASTKRTSGSLNQIVNRSAKLYSVKIERMQTKSDSLQLWLTDMPFDSLLGWIDNLEQQHGVVTENLDISATDISGMVKVRRLQLRKI